MGNYSIDQFSSITGITKFVLRTWENRYAYLKANRSETNIRIYNDEMIVRALNTNYLLEAGYKISKISKISEIELIKIVDEIKGKQIEGKENYYINQIIISTLEFSTSKFNKVFEEGVLDFGIIEFYKKVILTMLNRIGILWLTNKIGPSQEHFLSENIKQKLIVASDVYLTQEYKKETWLLFLPDNEFHEIGLLFARFLLVKNGFNVIYLGSNLPYESLNQVKEKIKIDNTLMFSVSNSSIININSTIEYLESNFHSANNYIVSTEITAKMIPEKSTINILSDVNSFINIISK
ncbi:MAG: MerR family transcriptional regulator [Flavobacteriales bacterium]|nr:MerR family transcriptional regulator [Flavobacteriales bacterium]